MTKDKVEELKKKLDKTAEIKINEKMGWTIEDLELGENELIDVLKSLIQDDDKIIRLKTLDILKSIYYEIQEEVIQLIVDIMWGDLEEDVRDKAAETLGFIDVLPEKIVPSLLKTLENDSSIKVKTTAASSLGSFPEFSNKIVPALIAVLLNEENALLIVHASISLAEIGKDSLQPLLELLCLEERGQIIFVILDIIGELGEKAKDSIPILEREMKKQNSNKLKFYFAHTIAILEQSMEGIGYSVMKRMFDDKEIDDYQLKLFKKYEVEYLLNQQIQNTENKITSLKKEFQIDTLKLEEQSDLNENDLKSIINSYLENITNVEKIIDNLKVSFENFKSEYKDKPKFSSEHLQEIKDVIVEEETFWQKWGGEIFIAIIGLVTTIIGTLLGIFLI